MEKRLNMDLEAAHDLRSRQGVADAKTGTTLGSWRSFSCFRWMSLVSSSFDVLVFANETCLWGTSVKRSSDDRVLELLLLFEEQ